jgi:O-antigen ligase
LIIAYAFCLPLSKAGISLFGAFLILTWLFEADFRKKYNEIKRIKLFLTLFAFLTFSTLAVIWSSDTLYALDYIKKYWHFLVMVVIYTSLQKKYIKHIFTAFLLGMLISEIVSYGIFFEIWTKEGVSPHDPSPFLDHTSYSVLLAFTAFILIYKIILTQNLPWRVFYTLYFLTAISNMFINGGRTGQVIFFVGLVFIGFSHVKNKIKASFLIIISTAIFGVTAYTLSSIFQTRFDYTIYDIQKMVTQKDFTGSLSARIVMWKIGTKNFLHSPIIGTGIGDEAQYSQEDISKYDLDYFVSSNGTFYYVDYHNAFVQYLVQLGIAGFILFLMIFYYLLKLKIDSQPYSDLLKLFIILYILWSMVGLSFHINSSMVFFTLFGAIFLKVFSLEQNISKESN